MKHSIRLFIALYVMFAFSFFLFACGHTHGDKRIADKRVVSKIKPGLTKDEVRRLCGEPNQVNMHNNLEYWTYHYYEMEMDRSTFIPIVNLFKRGGETKNYYLRVEFGTDDCVKNVDKGSGKSRFEGGLLHTQ